ncbi:MAG TPA: hypothetical protein PLB91_11095 [Spirochaetales bacterium]|nr:hypothetical protein [Spirochaetales bacterium]HRY55691.1 hypothetical protein [Spirochaetia bacterium]HRZ65432.1 hypothetical protein [Spirochaetia bacterium]
MENREAYVDSLYGGLDQPTRARVDEAVEAAAAIKARGGRIVVVTGSGPNIHEGVTTLVAELIRAGIVDGVLTSSAVVAHEMAGALDLVRRVDGGALGLPAELLPKGGLFEVSLLEPGELDALEGEMALDRDLVARARAAEGKAIIKAAGNMAYPMGLRTERLALEVESLARTAGLAFETAAGLGADPRTMIGAGAAAGVPVLVTVPQLVGGGMVGLCVGDSMPLRRRSAEVARLLGSADMIIESGIALSQEIHDGPFETYTGHGIWSRWEGMETYSLAGRKLVRIDLDPNLEAVWRVEREGASVQATIDGGLPKTKTFKVPFRMEMSGFARLEGSLPIVGDLGAIWPVLALRLARKLGRSLGFLSCPQESEPGREMREWIVREVGFVDRRRMLSRLREAPPCRS